MKRRLAYIALFFVALWAFFALQKPCFMLYNGAWERGVSFADYFRVAWHGLTLDATTVGYLSVVPWLVVGISVWMKRFPLRKVLVGYYVLVAAVVSLVFVVDMGLYPFWHFKLDASIFLYIDSPKNAMASVSAGFLLVRLLLIALLSGGCTWVLCRLTPVALPAVKRRLWGTVGMLLLGGALFVVIRGGVTESTANIGQAYFCNDEFLNHSAVNPAFNLLASVSKTKNYAEEFQFFDEARLDSLTVGLYPMDGKPSVELLRTKRPNILIILMESFGGSLVESLGGVKGVSPNIDRLAKEGVWFTRCYANSYRTDRGTICTFSGYQSFPTLSVMKIPTKSRTLPSIARKLLEVGYHTDFLYGGDINFTNMKSYLLESGYQKLTADVDFPLSQHKDAWGVNDDVTFDHLYKQLTTRTDAPWHSAFLTLSSHEPFEVPYHRLEEQVPNAFAFTDHCLGQFIDKLKRTPVWDDLLVICLPDHGFYYPFEGQSRSDFFQHIPMLWIGGAVKQPVVVDKIMNQSDMAATLLGQLGIAHGEFNFSRDVLCDTYTYPCAYWSYSGGCAFADSTGVSLVDLNTEQPYWEQPSHSEERSLRAKAILQRSYKDLGSR